MTGLRVSELNGGYGALQVLWDVSLTVGTEQSGEGEVAVVLGPNGAGKSSLLRAIVGDLPRSSGSISLSDCDLTRHDTGRRLRAGISWVPEGRNVFAHLSVRDNLRLSARLAGKVRSFDEAEARVVALFPVIGEKMQAQAGTLSGGQQQILAIARALVRDPVVALLDEPTIGLAPSIVDRLGEAIAETLSEGVSWLIAEQNLTWLSGLADRTYVLQGGRISASGGPELIGSQEAIRRAFFEGV